MKKAIKTSIFMLTALFVLSGVFYTSTITAEAATKTTTTSSTKKSKKVVKLKKKVKKARTTKKVKTKKKTKKYTQNSAQITKVTTTKTTTVTKYKGKKKTINTTVKTTIKTTTKTTEASKTNSTSASKTTKAAVGGTLTIDDLNGTVDPMVIKAFKTMNYQIVINGGVSYAGYFDGKNQRITLRSANKEYLLHELGHYVSFITGFKDSTAEFKSIYSKEASKFTGTNKAYVTQNSEEYFAESFRDFYTRPATLKSARPETYAYIVKTIDSISDARINYINAIYYS